MNKTIKWILIFCAAFGVLLAAALISLPFFINPNDYKDTICTVVQEQTGRVLTIPGDISLQISPKLDVAFSLGKIELAGNQKFSNETFASSKLAEIKLALWPLLTKKQIQINTIELKGVQLHLIRNADGTTNWDDLAASKPEKHPKANSDPQPKEVSSSEDTSIPTIDIGKININDINVLYEDKQAQKTLSLKNFNLTLGHIQEGNPFPVNADFTFELNDNKQPITAAITTDFDLNFNLSKQHFSISNLHLNSILQGTMFPSSKLEIALTTDLEVYARDEKIVIKKLRVTQGEVTVETALTLVGFKKPTIEGTFNLAEFSPKKQLTLLEIAQPRFSDSKVMDKLAASFSFSLEKNQLKLKEIQIQLDDTAIKADALIENLQNPAYSLNLSVDQFDLDRYAVKMEQKTQKTQKTAPVAPSDEVSSGKQHSENNTDTAEQQIILPVHLLRDLTFKVAVRIDTFKAAKLKMSDIVLNADGKDGLIRLQPFSAQLYEGSLLVTGAIDARQDIPVMRLKKVLQGVQLGPLFVDMTGKEEFSGRADIEAIIVTKGADKDALTRNANGTVTLSLSNGRIAKLQILETIRLAKALLDQKVPTPNSAAQPTGFATLTATGTITNGIFKNTDLLAQSDLMKITGQGSVDLVNEQVDYLLTVYLTDRIEREQGTGLVELGNTPIPYRIHGNFTEIKQSAAIEEMVKSKAKEALIKTLEKQLDTGTDKNNSSTIDAGSLINQGLKGLFGN